MNRVMKVIAVITCLAVILERSVAYLELTWMKAISQ